MKINHLNNYFETYDKQQQQKKVQQIKTREHYST